MEPDEEADSWVARTENELFSEISAKVKEEEDDDELGLDEDFIRAQKVAQAVRDLAPKDEDDPDSDEEEFADDEFADDDFDNDRGFEDSAAGFGPNAFPASELDGWVLDETAAETVDSGASPDGGPSENDLEELFDEDDSDSRGVARGPGTGWSGSR